MCRKNKRFLRLNTVLDEPEQGITAQQTCDHEAYTACKKKNLARIMSQTSMDDDIRREFKTHIIAKHLWDTLKTKLGSTTVARLRSINIKFDTYKKCPEHNMRKHLRITSNMINELADAGHKLTDEQQV